MKTLLYPLFFLLAFTAQGCSSDSRSDWNDDSEETGGGDTSVALLTSNAHVARPKADMVRTRLKLRAGVLNLSGGAKDLVNGEFVVRRKEWEPEVNYREEGGIGYLDITQPGSDNNIKLGKGEKNVWNLQLNDRTPMNLDIELPAGTADLELGSLNLNEIEMDAGAGDFEIDLRGSSARELEINAGVGEVTIDLSGDWDHDFNADINGGIGQVTLILPRNVGVRVHASGLGSIDADGFEKDGGNYVNDLYGHAKHNLRIDISGGLGSIELRLAD
ncbi:Cell wall-active antibiotics response 4TMS YvqF [Catalinimonas alkaloidigena]|uniref:Cell wall-active antibiotics response 4TMS YvqF n=1 Tax=Catalinimonas alkaloidigena TaxID=1075417 RepID=A0A1G9LP51_9BACT|nr:toast rack family protein [Catalinimonas alkaloidigena]SDL63567.1 Cell wall-active antibiotics response 4TMS YvqF [Catalinimonas alkaloidigena]